MQIRLVWPGPLSLPKALYYINRYLSMVVKLPLVAYFLPFLVDPINLLNDVQIEISGLHTPLSGLVSFSYSSFDLFKWYQHPSVVRSIGCIHQHFELCAYWHIY